MPALATLRACAVAMKEARRKLIGLSLWVGNEGGALGQSGRYPDRRHVPKSAALIQECQIAIGPLPCEFVENDLVLGKVSAHAF